MMKPSTAEAHDAAWLVRSANTTVGPVSLTLIERGFNLGRIPADALVAREGSDDWRPIEDILPAQEAAPESGAVVAVVARPVVAVEAPARQKPVLHKRRVLAPRRPVAAEPVAAVAVAEPVAAPEPVAAADPVAAARVARPLPSPRREPYWSQAMTSIMPRISLAGAGALDHEPVELPKDRLLPSALGIGTLALGILAAVCLLLNQLY